MSFKRPTNVPLSDQRMTSKKDSSSAKVAATPKILLAKPPGRGDGSFPAVQIMRDDGIARQKFPPGTLKTSLGGLKLVNEQWDFCGDRLGQLLTENADFTVVGILGPPGIGKSTLMNALYGSESHPPSEGGALPPFLVQAEQSKRPCSKGIELRVSPERLLLLDTQPVRSHSGMADTIRPDGSAAVQLAACDSLPADLAQEITSLQLSVYLCCVCHVVLVLFDGQSGSAMWKMMETVEMLKYGIADLSLGGSQLSTAASTSASRIHPGAPGGSQSGQQEVVREYSSEVIFVKSKCYGQECRLTEIRHVAASLDATFAQSIFKSDPMRSIRYRPPSTTPTSLYPNLESLQESAHEEGGTPIREVGDGEDGEEGGVGSRRGGERANSGLGVGEGGVGGVNYWVLPMRNCRESAERSHESYEVMRRRLVDEILSHSRKPFAKPLTERAWLQSASRVWELVKSSSTISDYAQMLKSAPSELEL